MSALGAGCDFERLLSSEQSRHSKPGPEDDIRGISGASRWSARSVAQALPTVIIDRLEQ